MQGRVSGLMGGGGSTNRMPEGGCPSGTHWHPQTAQCVPDEPVLPNEDINVSSITFNSSQSYLIDWEDDPTAKMRITPGSVHSGKAYYQINVIINGITANDNIIIGIQNFSSTYNTDYYDRNGIRIGRMVTNNNVFTSWTPTFSGEVDGPGWNAKGFFGSWRKCVVSKAQQMVDGSAAGAAVLLTCWAFGPECAIVVGGSCIITTLKG